MGRGQDLLKIDGQLLAPNPYSGDVQVVLRVVEHRDGRYLLHDRDTKYTQSFRAIIASGGVEPLVLPARSPNLNVYAERWVRSVKEECLSKGDPLRRALPAASSE
jgi:hypothetical protein